MTATMIPRDVLEQPQVQRLLGRSALYEALALLLTYPQQETLERADALLEDLGEHEVVARWGLGDHIARVRAAQAEVDASRLAPVHFVLFESSVLCSPHETEYIRDPLAKGAQLADVAGFYAAFGLKVSTEHRTNPDDIATELEFMSLITRKEAYALVQDWDERAAIARDGGRRFMELHLGRWTSAFATDLCGRADEAAATRDDPQAAAWFHAVGDLLQVAVASDMASLRIYPSMLTTRYMDPDADSLVCPMAVGDEQLISEEEIAIEAEMRASRPLLPPDPQPDA
jgi:putative dimethyl sulfoxide reductase chaperone